MDKKVEKIIDNYQGKPGAILSILEDIQDIYGYSVSYTHLTLPTTERV